MGKIKKILENELVGGTQTTDVYPVTSIKAVYDENNERLDHILNRRGVVNISTNYNADHIAEVLTLSQAIAKVPSSDRVIGFQGKYLASDGWHTIIYTSDNLPNWGDETKWIDLADKLFNSISNNATFAGIATPSTNPGAPDGPVYYFATPGIYANFSNITVPENTLGILIWSNGAWSLQRISTSDILTMTQDIGDNSTIPMSQRAITEKFLQNVSTLLGSSVMYHSGSTVANRFQGFGFRVDDNGSMASAPGVTGIDFLEIPDGMTGILYTRRVSTSTQGTLGLCFYDSDKAFISGVYDLYNYERLSYIIDDVDIPEGAKYFRTCMNDNEIDEFSAVLHNDNIKNGLSFTLYDNVIQYLKLIIGRGKPVRVNNIIWTNNSAANALNGNIEYVAGIKCSDFIEIDSSYSFLIYTRRKAISKSGTTGLAFYDENKNYISGELDSYGNAYPSFTTHIIPIPSNSCYIKANMPAGDERLFTAFCLQSLDDNVINYYLKHYAIPNCRIVELAGIGVDASEFSINNGEIFYNTELKKFRILMDKSTVPYTFLDYMAQPDVVYFNRSDSKYYKYEDGDLTEYDYYTRIGLDEYNNLIFKLLGGSIVKVNNFVADRAIMSNTGTVTDELTLCASGFISIPEESTNLVYTRRTTPTEQVFVGAAFYDKNMAYISGVADAAGQSARGYIFTRSSIPHNAKYIRFTFLTHIKDEFLVIFFGSYFNGILGTIFDSLNTSVSTTVNNTLALKMPLYKPSTMEHTNIDSYTVEELYSGYDNLANSYPIFIKRLDNDDKNDSSGLYKLRLYRIGFNQQGIYNGEVPDNNNLWTLENERNKIFITTGVHGNEKTASYGTYLFFKELLESNDDWAEEIKSSYTIYLIPCVNPWGYNNNSRENYNGVNINRDTINFSQIETKTFKEWFDTYSPMYFIDIHSTTGFNSYVEIYKDSKYFDSISALCESFYAGLVNLFMQIYSDAEYKTRFFISRSAYDGLIAEYAEKSLGIVSYITETPRDVKTGGTSNYLSACSITMAYLGNFIRSLTSDFNRL